LGRLWGLNLDCVGKVEVIDLVARLRDGSADAAKGKQPELEGIFAFIAITAELRGEQ
jgi:hypothetical protein